MYIHTHIISKAILIITSALVSSLSTTQAPAQTICGIPQLVIGSLDLPDTAHHSIFQAATAYILTNNDTFDNPKIVIVDLSDPTNLAIVGSTPIPKIATWITAKVHNNTLYIFDHDSFLILDITDPTNPQYIGTHTINSGNNITVVATHNDHMYIGTSMSRFEIIDISDPHAPSFVSQDFLQDAILTIINGVGYSTKLQAVDLSDPSNPIFLANPIFNNNHTRSYHDQGILYLTDFGGEVIDISDPFNPRRIDDRASIQTFWPETFAPNNALFFTVNEAQSGLHVSDASNPEDIYRAGTIEFAKEGAIQQIHARGDITFVITPSAVQAYNISAQPLAAAFRTVGPANDIALKDNIAIVATDASAIQLFDITDPTKPTLLSTFALNDNAFALDTVDQIAYIATEQGKLNLVDFSDPTNPSLISNIDTGRRTRDVNIVGSLAYVVDRLDGLHIFELTNPANPVLLSTTDTPGWARDITIDDDNKIAYLAHGLQDLQVIDIADPLAPAIIATIAPITNSNNFGSGILSSTISADFLYTAESSDGYRIFDISNPTNPIELARFDANPVAQEGASIAFVHQLAVNQNQLIVANGTAGFLTYDNTDPLNPIQTQWVPSREQGGISSVRRIQLRDDFALTTAFDGGLRIYNITGCQLPCPADLNGDSILDFFDLSIFIIAFTNQDPIADLNADGTLDFFDISTLLQFFSQGCP